MPVIPTTNKLKGAIVKSRNKQKRNKTKEKQTKKLKTMIVLSN